MRHTFLGASRATTFALILVAASAATAEDDATIVVTGTRFEQSATNLPTSVSVITREDIRHTPALNLPDLLKSQTGIELRTLYGSLGIDAALDIRGFGETGASNSLVLLDGQRLNPVDAAGIDWSTIPLESIQRIEILRGSGTVLFGDRASGGVINIITDKSAKARADVRAAVGSYGYRGIDASAAGGGNLGYANIAVHTATTDGYRQNSQQDEQSLAGRAGAFTNFGEVFVNYSASKNSSGLPGALGKNAFQNDPHQSASPSNIAQRTGWRLRPGIRVDLNRDATLEAEIGIAEDNARFLLTGFTSDRERRTLSATPRLRWRHGLARLNSETVIGLDVYRAKVEDDSASAFLGGNRQTADQESTAVYAQNTTDFTSALHVTTGLRHQRMRQRATDDSVALHQTVSRGLNAYDIGLSYDLSSAARIYGKTGSTFRFPNTDELFGFDPVTFATIFRGDLRPQHGPLNEVGLSWHNGSIDVQASIYQLELDDEIDFNNITGNNENFPRTRRRGLELEGRWNIASTLQARLSVAETRARFTAGTFSGKAVPLAARHKMTAGLTWNPTAYGTYSLVVNHVGRRYAASDLNNVAEQLDAYTTVDLLARLDLRPWTITARLMNALNHKYAAFAALKFDGTLGYYPADPRALVVSVRYAFK